MKKRFLPWLALLPITCLAQQPAPIEIPQYGISILPLVAKEPGTEQFSPLMMALPAKDGFASNVNVGIVGYEENLDAYIKLSKDGFKSFGVTLLKESKNGDNEWSIEYTGEMAKRKLHWYARAILSDGKVYLVTATTTEEDWPSLETQLREVVDSFKVKPPVAPESAG